MELVERKLKIVFYFHLNKNICIGQVQFFFCETQDGRLQNMKNKRHSVFQAVKIKQKKAKI